MKKILAIMSMAAVSAMAISASRVGPVSTYGELKANGGKLSGSCPEYANKAVQVKGQRPAAFGYSRYSLAEI